MSTHTELVDRYIAIWNESDAARRRHLIAETWAEDANYLDPALEADGRAGIDRMIEQIQARFPGHRFRRTSDVEVHHDRVRFRWELAPDDGPAMVGGTDFGVVAAGRLRSITGFFDQAPSVS